MVAEICISNSVRVVEASLVPPADDVDDDDDVYYYIRWRLKLEGLC